MQGDGEDEDSRCEVTNADEPPIGPTCSGANLDGVFGNVDCCESKGNSLLNIGEEEIVYQYEELICATMKLTFAVPAD